MENSKFSEYERDSFTELCDMKIHLTGEIGEKKRSYVIFCLVGHSFSSVYVRTCTYYEYGMMNDIFLVKRKKRIHETNAVVLCRWNYEKMRVRI